MPERSINQNIPEKHVGQNSAAFTGPVEVLTIPPQVWSVDVRRETCLFRRWIVSIIVRGLKRASTLCGARRDRLLNCSDLQFQIHMNVSVLFYLFSQRQNIRIKLKACTFPV